MSTIAEAQQIFRRMRTVITIDPDETVDAAVEKMTANDVGCLVITRRGEILGILSERDVVSRLVSQKLDPQATPVSEIMTTQVVVCDMETTITKVQHMMTGNGIRHLPIVEEGVLVGMISSRDILACQLYEATSRLAKATKEVKSARAVRQEFLNNVSHEIRTPMNGILGLAEIAMETASGDEQKRLLGMIRDSGNELMDVINNILVYSDLDNAAADCNSEAFSLSDLLGGVVNRYRTQADAKGIRCCHQIAPGVPEQIIGDPDRLDQVLSHLLSNAVKFTDRGMAAIHVSLQDKGYRRATLRFAVDDTGIGISGQKREAIFEPFRQEDGSHARRFGGAGLGLSIAASLVKTLGGEIQCQSEPGRGSTFYFNLTFQLPTQDSGTPFARQADWRKPAGEPCTEDPTEQD